MLGDRDVYTVQLTSGGEALCVKTNNILNFFQFYFMHPAEDYGYVFKDIVTQTLIFPDTCLNDTVAGPGVYPNPRAVGHVTYVRGSHRCLSKEELDQRTKILLANDGEKADEYRLRMAELVAAALRKKLEDKAKNAAVQEQVNDLRNMFK